MLRVRLGTGNNSFSPRALMQWHSCPGRGRVPIPGCVPELWGCKEPLSWFSLLAAAAPPSSSQMPSLLQRKHVDKYTMLKLELKSCNLSECLYDSNTSSWLEPDILVTSVFTARSWCFSVIWKKKHLMQSNPTTYEKYSQAPVSAGKLWLVTLFMMSAQQTQPTVLMLLLC